VSKRSPETGGSSGAGSRPLGNGLLDEKTMARLLEDFVRELPGRASKISGALQASDLEAMKHFSHQLKGAAAIYGFAQISRASDRVYQLAAGGAGGEELPAAVDELVRRCQGACEQA